MSMWHIILICFENFCSSIQSHGILGMSICQTDQKISTTRIIIFLMTAYPTKRKKTTKATVFGTLMKVTDYVEEEDGRLTLLVQGVERIKIISACQHKPYAIASKVKIWPDQEYWEPYAGKEAMASMSDATQVMAAKESELYRELEFYNTVLSKNGGGEVSPLSNVNGSVVLDSDNIMEQAKNSYSIWLEKTVKDEATRASLATVTVHDERLEETIILLQEKKVWILLDSMIQLLNKAQSGLRIPVPSQLLGLLPNYDDWPPGFQLHTFVENLEDKEVGTHTKSPFVLLSKAYPQYPTLRRASRLSYTIWIITGTISTEVGVQTDYQELLELSGMQQRLQRAIQQLEAINSTIKAIVG
mmetsp:Transcript_13189/g.19403  ORF Transcript_13189/g.19403 Transcript_13189/m.19403 type:complete len:358 (-) Transcript_13189:243-1316(-)